MRLGGEARRRPGGVAVALAVIGVCVMGGCKTAPPGDALAVLASADAESLRRLEAALGQAMGRASIARGPEDPTVSSRISVLPPPVHPSEDRSLALPTHFTLRLEQGDCVLVREDTGAVTPLPGVVCRPAP